MSSEVVELAIVDKSEQSTLVYVDPRVAETLFEHDGTPVLYVADAGDDPAALGDSFESVRQRVMNAIAEIRASKDHPLMERLEQPMALARQVLEQQAVLLYNMLGQAGMLEARAKLQQAEMENAMAESEETEV